MLSKLYQSEDLVDTFFAQWRKGMVEQFGDRKKSKNIV